MTEYAYRILNVFAREGRLTGNPLCVFEDGRAWTTRRCRRSRGSSTSRRPPSSCRRTKATARVRIFTPSYEMPFAGHPTLGTAHVVRALKGGDAVTLEMKAGIIPVNARATAGRCRPMPPKSRVPSSSHRRDLAEILGLQPGDIGRMSPLGERGPRAADRAAHECRSGAARAAAGRCVHAPEERRGREHGVRVPDAGDAMGTVESRFFFPSGPAILEDPATGSACANLGGWFSRHPARRPTSSASSPRAKWSSAPRRSILEVTRAARSTWAAT